MAHTLHSNNDLATKTDAKEFAEEDLKYPHNTAANNHNMHTLGDRSASHQYQNNRDVSDFVF